MRNTTLPKYRFWGNTPPPQDRDCRLIRNDVATTTEGKATMYLFGPIDSWGGLWGVSAAEVATALTELPQGTTDLELRINSPGGEVFEGVAIMNLLADHPAKITAKVDGWAASAASFIAVAADELIMGKSTELMIHDAWGIAMGNEAALRAYADLLDRTSNDIANVYERKAGGGVEAWRDYMREEKWFTAEEAVAAGLADSVAGEEAEEAEEAAAAARAQFDLSALYQHKNRADAPAPAPVPTATAGDDTAEHAAAQEAERDRRHRHNARRLSRT